MGVPALGPRLQQVRRATFLVRHRLGSSQKARWLSARELQRRTLRFEQSFGSLDLFLEQVPESSAPFLTTFRPGHFYSPIPEMSEVDEHPRPLEVDHLDGLPGLKMNAERQLALFRGELAPRAREIELPRDHDPAWRFSLDNWSFPIGDALVYGSILRYLKPKQMIEVGSGWTTGLALDINDKYLGGAVQITAIEPYPEIVRRIIRREDHIKIIDSPVQSVSLDLFRALEEGDILFIDSSHVLKFGSDVYHILTRILPVLSPGVVIHFHDVFWPFEYPSAWLKEGRAWNESYAVRAFLLFNTEFQVMFFNDWFAKRYRSVALEEAPAFLENAGASLWIRRAGGASG